MAIASVVPLASKLLICSTRQLKPVRRTIPTPGMGRTMRPFPINMSLRTTISEDDAIQRRTGNHHLNLWDDDFIQSLSTPYGASYYRERADRLIEEVKDLFFSMYVEDGEFISPSTDLLQRLLLVDNIERLGIDRHFKNEIKTTLDYVYSHWGEKGIGCGRESAVTDLNSTALGLRTLRLHGYTVSSDVLEQFKQEKGQFACSQTAGEIKCILNLFRASLIAFPGEKVIEEAEIFCRIYLKEALQKIPISSLSKEIEYVLEDGWHTNLPRLEARNYIDVFGQDLVYEEKLTQNLVARIGRPSQRVLFLQGFSFNGFRKTEKLLELAKLEFNIFHSFQQRELKHVSRWWKNSGFSELTFTRHRHVEYYALASCIATEPKHSAFRLGFTKICHLATVLDDIYDTFGTVDELQLFTEAIKRWHPSASECLPEYMKLVYMMFYETVNEMAREAEKFQGRDTLNYARQAWDANIGAYMTEAKWISSGYLPTFKEYLDNGKVSFGYRTATLQPILTLDIPFPHQILQEIDFPSKFNDLACSILRLRGDSRSYEADRLRGEEASSISCYMKDNPESTEEEALAHINALIGKQINELNWELLKPDSNVPISSKKHSFDIFRSFCHLYKYRDGFTIANIETKNLVMRTVMETVYVPM